MSFRNNIEDRVPADAIQVMVLIQIQRYFEVLPELIDRYATEHEGVRLSERELTKLLMEKNPGGMKECLGFALQYVKQEIEGAPVHNGRDGW